MRLRSRVRHKASLEVSVKEFSFRFISQFTFSQGQEKFSWENISLNFLSLIWSAKESDELNKYLSNGKAFIRCEHVVVVTWTFGNSDGLR